MASGFMGGGGCLGGDPIGGEIRNRTFFLGITNRKKNEMRKEERDRVNDKVGREERMRCNGNKESE